MDDVEVGQPPRFSFHELTPQLNAAKVVRKWASRLSEGKPLEKAKKRSELVYLPGITTSTPQRPRFIWVFSKTFIYG